MLNENNDFLKEEKAEIPVKEEGTIEAVKVKKTRTKKVEAPIEFHTSGSITRQVLEEKASVSTPEGDIIETTLTKLNLTTQALAEMKNDYMKLTISGLDDKEGYAEVYQARIKVKNTRILTTKACKEGRAEAIAVQKKWIKVEGEIVSQLEEVENYLQSEQDKVDKEKERIKAEKEEKEQERLQQRIALITSKGMVYNGVEYRLGEIVIPSVAVKLTDEFSWNGILAKLEIEAAVVAAQKAEAERIQKLAAEEALKKAKELAEKEAQLAAREKAIADAEAKAKAETEQRALQAKIDQEKALKEAHEKELKLAAETRALEDAKIKQRLSMMEGLLWNGETGTFGKEFTISREELLSLNTDEFAELSNHFLGVKEAIRVKAEAAKKAEMDAIAEKARVDAEAKLKVEQEAKAAKELKEKAEKERQASLRPDSDKLGVLSHSIMSIILPEMSTEEGKAAIQKISVAMEKLSVYINALKDTLK